MGRSDRDHKRLGFYSSNVSVLVVMEKSGAEFIVLESGRGSLFFIPIMGEVNAMV